MAPFGIGAVIGGGANAAMAALTVRAGRRAFGPPPESWPTTFEATAASAPETDDELAAEDVDGLDGGEYVAN